MTFLFQVWPYAAMALFAIGIAIRYVLARKKSAGCARDLDEARDLFGGRRILFFSLLMLFLGHLAGLLFPHKIILWNSVPSQLYALEGLAFLIGLSAFGAWARLMWQQLGKSHGSVLRQVGDAVFLSLLFITMLSGLLTAVFYRWGSSWGVLTLTPYGLSLLRGKPAVALVAGLPFLVQVHVFSGFVALAMLPFTRVAPILVVALRRGGGVIAKPISALTGWARRMLDSALRKHHPATWIWPEED
ncbi:MAG TPA: respiratory nitrate reductase subunit gamma [Bryobacteraceae bacterium]